MNSKYILGAAALTVGIAIVAPKAVKAYRGDPSVAGPNYTEERHASMTAFIENGDYEAWKELMDGRGRITEVVTEENFDEFAKAHLSGDTSEFRASMGLGLQNGSGRGRHGQGGGRGGNR